MKIIAGALIALVLSLAEAATDGALRGKRGAPPARLQVEGPYKDLYDKAKDHYTVTKDKYDDAARDWYDKGKNHYKENKDEYNDLAKDLHGKGEELLKTSLPPSAMATLEKIADALCSVDGSPNLHYAVELAKRIYTCDEEAIGMIVNSATTAVAEALVLKSHSNHTGLAVSDEWGWAKDVMDDVGEGMHDAGKFAVRVWECCHNCCK